MNFSAIKTLLRISILGIAIACFVECFVIEPLKNSANAGLPSSSHALVGFASSKKECTHDDVIIGKAQDGQLQTFVEIVKKSKSWFHRTTVEINYPSGNTKNECNITQIKIENLNKGCNCNNETIQVKGGSGYKFFNISITSGIKCPNEHKVSCYTKC